MKIFLVLAAILGAFGQAKKPKTPDFLDTKKPPNHN